MNHIEQIKHNILAYHSEEGCSKNDQGEATMDPYDWIHQELDDYVNRMWQSQREDFLIEYGLEKALEDYFKEFSGEPKMASLVYGAFQRTLFDDEEIRTFLDA